METLWWLLTQIIWLIWAVLSWLVGYLLWLAFWVLAPVILIAIVALRAAEYALGRDAVRAWVKKRSAQVRARHLASLAARAVRARRAADPRAGLAGRLCPLAQCYQPALDAQMGPLAARLGSALAQAVRVREWTQVLLSQRLAKPSRPCGRKMTIRMKMMPSGIR